MHKILKRGDIIKRISTVVFFIFVGVFIAKTKDSIFEMDIPSTADIGIVKKSSENIKKDVQDNLKNSEEEVYSEDSYEEYGTDDGKVIVVSEDLSSMARKLKSYGSNSAKSVDSSSKTTKTSSGSVPGSWLKKYDSVIASYYGEYFHGRLTANGEIYNMNALTAAHKTLPLGSVVKVTNIVNNKSVIVTINDRGPYIDGREIDLSKGSFSEIGDINKGLMTVNIEVLSIGDNKYKKQK